MDDQKLQKFIGKASVSLAESMMKINEMSRHILFLVDENKRLMGTLTDGDIRRYILKGGRIEDSSLLAANCKPIVAYDMEKAVKLHQAKYQAIPVINDEKQIVDIYEGEEIKRTYGKLGIPVVINAGGKGTRLEPFTKVLPKPLIPVGERPIIELIMQEYQKYECCDFHIIVNYKRDLIKAYFSDNESRYNITWYDEDEPLGTGGGLTLLRGTLNSTFFFANCDALLTADYESMFKFHKENKNAITMICAYKNLNIPYGVVEMGVNGTIEDMKEKPVMSFLTNTGIYIVEPEVIDDMKNDVPIGFPDIVEMQRKKGRKAAVFPISENDWMDMGQLPELEKMRMKLYGE